MEVVQEGDIFTCIRFFLRCIVSVHYGFAINKIIFSITNKRFLIDNDRILLSWRGKV